MSSFYRQQLEQWLSQLDVKADRVLDVGGSQLPVKDRVKSWDVKEYKILDLEQPHEDSTKPDIVWDINKKYEQRCDYVEKKNVKKNNQIRSWCNRCNKWGWATKIFCLFEHFDMIICLEVMEYVFDPVTAIKNIAMLIKKYGILYITFPTVYPTHEPREQDYLRYTKSGAIKLLESTGFEVLEIIPRTTKQASLRQFYAAEKMRAAKGYDGHEDVGYIIKAQKV